MTRANVEQILIIHDRTQLVDKVALSIHVNNYIKNAFDTSSIPC